MLKYIWNRGQTPTVDKEKLQKELYAFSKNVLYGFPHKPVSMDWDPQLKLLAIATKNGFIRIFGQPGVELTGQMEDKDLTLRKILFLPAQGRLITLAAPENILHFWEIDDNKIEKIKTTILDSVKSEITTLTIDSNKNILFMGTKDGDIYQLHLWSFILDKEVITQENLLANIPEDHKENPGEVVQVAQNPFLPDQIMIGYTAGFMVLWDTGTNALLNILKAPGVLNSLCWKSEDEFYSSHDDGSFTVWDAENGAQIQAPHTPYGPYPCKSIAKVYCKETEEHKWCVFSGGMPRSTHGDKYTVSVMKNDENHIVFELSSKVIDFLVIENEYDPDTLVVLSEEETVFIDLVTKSWPVFEPPYLHSIHASAITCLAQFCDILEDVFDRIENLSLGQQDLKFSTRDWPICGGECDQVSTAKPSLIITGHEDGKVKFWLSKMNSLKLITALDTARYFTTEEMADGSISEASTEEWPPFRKVGNFDPFTDDPRFAIKTIDFCRSSGVLLVGGIAGQLLLCNIDNKKEYDVPVTDVEIMAEDEDFVWKGQDPLGIRACQFKHPAGFQPCHILQVDPPSAITSLALNNDWGLFAAGTAFGFIIFDMRCHQLVTTKATVNSTNVESNEENPLISTNKSLKNSLRESFNKIRRSHTHRCHEKKRLLYSEQSKDIPEFEIPESCLMERRGNPEDGSLVRCLHFSCTFIDNNTSTSPTLWVGTNSGQVLVLSLSIPEEVEKRQSDGIIAALAKEIQLKHMAPVIDIEVLDAKGTTVRDDNESIGSLPHKVLICSEEQFKLFSLPGLVACGKYKVTANEGVVVRRAKTTAFGCLPNPTVSENCLLFLSNLGEISAFSLPDLKCQMKVSAVRNDNHVGISSFVFSDTGKGLYMSSCSELQEISVSAADGCSSMGGRIPLKSLGRDSESQIFRENEVIERSSCATTVQLMSVDGTYSEMSTSVNSEASYDIDIVKHHDVATSTANLLDASDSDSDDNSDDDDDSQNEKGKLSCAAGGAPAAVGDQDGLHAWLGVSWLIFYLMFILFLLYKRKTNMPGTAR